MPPLKERRVAIIFPHGEAEKKGRSYTPLPLERK